MSEVDVLIIGAGAAGMMCAAVAGQRGRKVLLIDHAEKPGEKIRISGGGRCNFTNLHCSPKNFVSHNPHFAKSALARFTPKDFIALVEKYGVAYHEKTLGQLFCDGSAQQIINLLLSECEKGKVELWLKTEVSTISKTDNGFMVTTSRGPVQTRSLVIATGGPSIPKMGSSAFGYKVAEQFDIPVIPPRAALVPLTFSPELLAETQSLSGLSIPDAEVKSAEGIIFREGLLFTHRGLSGPSILQISTYWNSGEAISVNLLPDFQLFDWLKQMRSEHGKQMLHNIMSERLPRRLAEFLIAKCGLVDARIADVNDARLRILCDQIQNWKITPLGTEGYRTAEVTRGGVDTRALSSKTLEAEKVPGLYFIGETVDVTGHLGGHNFQWAWASGFCCGSSL